MGFFWNLFLVYPKVKVREQQDQDDHQHVVPDFRSTVKEHEDKSPPSIAKVPKSYIPSIGFSSAYDIPNVTMLKTSELTGEEKDNNKLDEDSEQNIRASSIPRPRAVLSSPDNDLAIGNKNRCKKERSSVLKNRNLVQNRHALCKIIPKTTEDSINTKKAKEDPDESKGKKASAVVGPTQRRQTRIGKASSMRV
ncbi:hypothetical protein PanWU01x14_314640 [Parasponia andersonii]|uniref:Uncharacterized protein n=1 Tax=Parasponia andersonii TaxID=3476 RepID=A0A2P5ANY8_PARAD|nr:hypothetical protein PanWU01x14_314640 [Parasponia andersonii]